LGFGFDLLLFCFLILIQACTVGSIFFFGYLIAEFPSNALIQKLPVGKLAAISCMGWASTTMLLGACNNAAGLMVVRFIMGAFEAPIVPALSIMTVMWYMKREQPVRVAIWYSGFSSVSPDSQLPTLVETLVS
jgi:MFS family permease